MSFPATGSTYAGPRSGVGMPEKARMLDVQGAFILPGFFNTHVHHSFDDLTLRKWALAGVTTVLDLAIDSRSQSLASLIALRRSSLSSPAQSRLLSAGYLITVPGGYCAEYMPTLVTSPEEARRFVQDELSLGVDVIKIALETGYAGVTGLTLPTGPQIAAIISPAHAGGKKVIGHVTQAKYLQQLVESGADAAAHMPYDHISDDLIGRMVAGDFIVIPTLSVLEYYGALPGTSGNLKRFVDAGGLVALGNDHTSTPPAGYEDHWEMGMPMHEIGLMRNAGMTPLQIIVAGTRNAARLCGRQDDLGTVAAGKIADILVVNGNPLQDLNALTKVRFVIHNGAFIQP